MEKSRIKNTIRNVRSGIIVQIINKVMAFIVRTVFIRILNTEYLGVNGLFTNILTVLSFAELGIGTAIIFSMYKPVAEDDTDKIKSLMRLYKKSYNTIGIVVFILGICVIPFMKYIIKDAPNIKESIILIYVLFLINTSVSYFFTYKKSIITAHQQESIINRIDSFFYLIKSILEIVFLILTKNYILYLIIQVACTIFENIIISYKANKMFPYLKEKNVKELEKEEKKSIFINIKSLVIYKLGTTILGGTDNIIISSIIGVAAVGLCSNYVLITDSIRGIITNVLNGVTSSVGNLNASADGRKKETIFYQLTFVSFWIHGFCATAFVVLLNPFINLWLGSEFVLPNAVSVSLALSFFICGIRMPAYTYRVTMGLFERGKMTPFLASIINIVLSIALGRIMGVSGVFFATAIAQLFSYSIIDPYLIYKYEFKSSIKGYVKKIVRYFTIFIITCILAYIFASLIRTENFINLIVKGIIVTIVSNLMYFIFYCFTYISCS